MSYQVLARKYRPQRFSDVIGQDHVTRTLKNAIGQGRIAHGYIFSGHRGIGKTTIARILAMALNCRSKDHPVPEPCGICESCTEIRAGNAVDVIEIDAATNRGIDEIRELREAARYRPARDRYKIYILDEAHQITDAAYNALLKTLEEPPGHIIFMMATTQPEDIPQTIRSRCQNFSFHAVRFDEIVQNLRQIATAEKIEADDNALAMLAEVGDGSMRDALSIMDQAIACCGERLSSDTVRGLIGSVPSETLEDLMLAVQRNSSQEVLQLIDQLMIQGQNPAHFAKQLVRFLRNVIVAKVATASSPLLQISRDEAERVGRVAELFSEEDLTRFLQIMLRTHSDLGYKHEQRFHLELGLLKLVHAQRLLPLEQLLSDAPTAKPPVSTTVSPRSTSVVTRSTVPESVRSEVPTRPRGPSPFEADTARKNPFSPKSSTTEIISGTSAVAVAAALETTPTITPDTQPVTAEISIPKLQTELLSALENSKQSMLAQMLETGGWAVNGSEVTITVAKKQTLIDASMGAEAKRIISAAALKVGGTPVRVKVVSGTVNGGESMTRAIPRSMGDGTDARSRAQSDPLVRRMKEKFGAEIRIVVDQRDKR